MLKSHLQFLELTDVILLETYDLKFAGKIFFLTLDVLDGFAFEMSITLKFLWNLNCKVSPINS